MLDIMKKSHKTSWVMLLCALLLTTCLSFTPNTSFADDSNTQDSGVVFNVGSTALLTPASKDLSILYLGEIFGSVGTVLAGSGSFLLSDMYGVFNQGVLAVSTFFFIYTTIVGIMNSAGEGEFLGRKMSSIWVPIRTVFGVAMVVPDKASRYCVNQVMLMSVS